jgi:hypothetical protein
LKDRDINRGPKKLGVILDLNSNFVKLHRSQTKPRPRSRSPLKIAGSLLGRFNGYNFSCRPTQEGIIKKKNSENDGEKDFLLLPKKYKRATGGLADRWSKCLRHKVDSLADCAKITRNDTISLLYCT